MSSTVENVWEDSDTNTTTFAFTPGGVPADGSLLIACIVNTKSAGFSAADSWATLGNESPGAFHTKVLWRTAGGSEPATYNFTSEDATDWAGCIIEISGHDPSDPIDDFAVTTGRDVTAIAPSVTTTRGDDLIISGALSEGSASPFVIDTDLTGSGWDVVDGSGDVATGGGTVNVAAVGATGSYSHDQNANSKYMAFTIAIKDKATVIDVNANSQKFTSYNVIVTLSGEISAKHNRQVFTSYNVTVLHPTTLSIDHNAQKFTSYNIVRTFKPKVEVNHSAQKFESFNVMVDGFYVGQVVPGVWPDERPDTGKVEETGG